MQPLKGFQTRPNLIKQRRGGARNARQACERTEKLIHP